MQSVWKQFPHTWRYRIRHPIECLMDRVRSVRWAWQRSVRGYADIDWWNMCDWMSDVLPGMFETYAAKHFGFPGEDAGFTDEEWTAYLCEIAEHLRNASEDQEVVVNEYQALFDAVVEDQRRFMERSVDADGVVRHIYPETTSEQQIIRDKYFNRGAEIYAWRQEEARKAFEMIGRHFFALWD